MKRIANRWQSVVRGVKLLVRPGRPASRPNAVRLLAILPPGPDRLQIHTLSSEAGWDLTISDTPSAIVLGLRSGRELAPIILYDRELSPHTWRETIWILTRKSPRPYLILLSPTSDRNLWDELQRVGGSDVLRTPVDRESALRAVSRAWSLCESEQHVRLAAAHSAT